MSETALTPSSFQFPVRRLFWLPLGLSVMLLLTVLSGLVGVAWRSLERIQPVQAHLKHIGRIQDVALSMEQMLLRGMRGAQVDSTDLQRLRQQIMQITHLKQHLNPNTQLQLKQMFQTLDLPQQDPRELLIKTLAQLREVLRGERDRHDLLLSDVARDSATELKLAIILLVVLPLAGGVLLLLLQVRIKHPLEDLGNLLGHLAARDYRPVPESSLEESAGLVQPVFRSYNELVSRLRELEMEHRNREHTLEQEVRQATEALLAQSRELARAERLAAVGAVSAGLAHELRNPLAGILMACSKLQRNLDDQGQVTRVSSVLAELKRINGLLTQQVDDARHVPEPLVQLQLSELVEDLLVLVRYQIPAEIHLVSDIPSSISCLLPGAGLRQALLNLILNAVHALGENGQITIAAEHRDDELVLSVSDDGPGFPAEMLQAGAIRPFATGRAGGTGLGLAMVRRFTRDHAGELELHNREPRGACVTLHLPCSITQTAKEKEKSYV